MEQPQYQTQPEYTEQPPYQAQPEYAEQPQHQAQPEYIEQPQNQTGSQYENQPQYQREAAYEEMPQYQGQTGYEEQPQYQTQTEYAEQPQHQAQPEYIEEPQHQTKPTYEAPQKYEEADTRLKYTQRPRYQAQPQYQMQEPEYEAQPQYQPQAAGYEPQPQYQPQAVRYEPQPQYQPQAADQVQPQYETESLREEQPQYKAQPEDNLHPEYRARSEQNVSNVSKQQSGQSAYDGKPETDVVVTEDTELSNGQEPEKKETLRIRPSEGNRTDFAKAQKDLRNVKPVTQMAVDVMETREAAGAKIKEVLNHLMIEAKTPQKGLQIAIDTLKKIHKESGRSNPVVKIQAEKLNQRGLLNLADKLTGKDLIVEEAGDLNEGQLEALRKLVSRDETGMIIVLIDNPLQIERLHRQNPGLANLFECIGTEEEDAHTSIEQAVQRQVELETQLAREEEMAQKKKPVAQLDFMQQKEPDSPLNDVEMARAYTAAAKEPAKAEESGRMDDTELDLDAFANYACDYAKSIDCSITGKSMLALYERIEIMEEDGIPLTRGNAEKMIEEAADKAEKPSFGGMIKGMFSSKYDKDGMLILREEHFI